MRLFISLALAALLAGCATGSRNQVQAILVQLNTTKLIQAPSTAASQASVVLLGEQHDSAADHRWELSVIKRLHVAMPDMELGFEMFPRAAQPVLNAWVSGQLTEAAFLKQSDWAHVWGFNADLYMPIFRFARDHHLPMIALNVSHRLVHLVAQRGWDGVAVEDREGIGTPARASNAYEATLMEAMGDHGRTLSPALRAHFVDAQLLWDRAMAEGIAAQHGRRIVAIMGAGHLEHLQGVPYQLGALGITDVVALLPPAPDS